MGDIEVGVRGWNGPSGDEFFRELEAPSRLLAQFVAELSLQLWEVSGFFRIVVGSEVIHDLPHGVIVLGSSGREILEFVEKLLNDL